MSWIIRRGSRGSTTGGRPVGDVYVTGPHFGEDVFSHTYEPNEAAAFSRLEDAERMIAKHPSWDGAYPVRLADAPNLEFAASREP